MTLEEARAELGVEAGADAETVRSAYLRVIEIQSSAGDSRLGGEDFVEAMASALAARIGLQPASTPAGLVSWARLRAACEQAKRGLTAADEARVTMPDLIVDGRPAHIDERITRAEAEQLWVPLLDRLRAPTLRALRDANLRPEQIGEVLLVGGATRMPCVVRFAAQVFDRMPERRLPPDEAVALGAAVQAALKQGHVAVEDVVVTDVAPFTLGVAVADSLGAQLVQGIFAPIIERGTVIPVSRMKTFSTVSDNQREILIEVYQGEHANCEKNKKLGQYKLKDIPRGPAGTQPVEVRFSYDLNGILEVDMTILPTGRKESLVVEQTPGRLSAAQVAAARKALERLKFHPRESLPNTTALARADALYVELTGPAREALGQAIAIFRAAMEAQDPKAIEETRTGLLAVVDRLT